MQETTLRRIHAPFFGLILLVGIVALAISASLVTHYNNNGYPNNSYRDRIRILLVASIWTVAFSAYLLFGTLFAASRVIFGIAAHLFGLLVGFLLFMIGAASLTALTAKADMSLLDRGNIVRGLVAISWIETILLLVALIFIFILGIKSRSGAGMRRSTLLEA